ncbi:hypothetical protein AOLI_G00324670 [Acnodon oligacanthus]
MTSTQSLQAGHACIWPLDFCKHIGRTGSDAPQLHGTLLQPMQFRKCGETLQEPTNNVDCFWSITCE